MKRGMILMPVLVLVLAVGYAIAQQQPATDAAAAPPVAVPAAAADLPRTISVTGTAMTRTAPDVIIWNIRLVDQHVDLQAAKQANDAKLARIFDLREELDLEPGDLETGHVRINREFERDAQGRQGDFKQFAVHRQVTIRQRDRQRFDEFLDRLVASAEMEVSFSYDTTRLHEVRAETRLDAARIAQDKASEMAQVLGAQLGPILAINEHRPDGSAPAYGMVMQNAIHFDPGSRAVVDLAAGRFAPGAIDVQVTVYTTFLLN